MSDPLYDHYLPDRAGTAVVEMLSLHLGERMLREAFLLAHGEDEEALEEKLSLLLVALETHEASDTVD